MVTWSRDGKPSASLPLQFDSETTTMKTRKLIYLALFSASTALSPSLLTGSQPALLAQVDACQHCAVQFLAPTISLSQLFL